MIPNGANIRKDLFPVFTAHFFQCVGLDITLKFTMTNNLNVDT